LYTAGNPAAAEAVAVFAPAVFVVDAVALGAVEAFVAVDAFGAVGAV
jgi:hypothetical protein